MRLFRNAFGAGHKIISQLVQSVVVVFFRTFPFSPPVTFQFADKVYARFEYINIWFAVVFSEITFHRLNTRKQIFVDSRVGKDTVVVKKFGNAFFGSERFLIRGGIDKGADSSRAVFFSAEPVRNFFYFFRMIDNVFARFEMLGDYVNVVVAVHAIPVRG